VVGSADRDGYRSDHIGLTGPSSRPQRRHWYRKVHQRLHRSSASQRIDLPAGARRVHRPGDLAGIQRPSGVEGSRPFRHPGSGVR
jgi:hypothetical protein